MINNKIKTIHMLAIVLAKGNDKLLGALSLQKSKDFTVYLPTPDPLEADYEAQLVFRHGDWHQVEEPLLCILEPGALPGPDFVKEVLNTAKRHPEYNVYHLNLEEGEDFPRKADAKKLFKLILTENAQAPLSSFVFRAEPLREKAVQKADGSLYSLPSVFSMAPVREVSGEKLAWKSSTEEKDPANVERHVMAKLDFFRWTEDFFGDDDYPLSVRDQLQLFARELAKLYPSYSAENLKEIMNGFQVAQKNLLRKFRAGRALKSALKEREKELAGL